MGTKTWIDIHRHPSLAELEQDEGPPLATAADVLFTTTQRRLLGFLFGQPDRSFHYRELLELSGSGKGATLRELRRLESGGLVRLREQGARTYYQANRDCPAFPALSSLVRESFGLAGVLRAAFVLIRHQIELAFVFDSFDHDFAPRPPLELMLVARAQGVAGEGIDFAVHVAQARLRRGLLATVVRPEELREPRWFVGQALAQPRVWVFGDEARLAAMTSGP